MSHLVTEIVNGRRVQYHQYHACEVGAMTVEAVQPDWALTNAEADQRNAPPEPEDVPTPEPEPEVDEAEELLEDLIVESIQVVADQLREQDSRRLVSADENALLFAEQQATMSNPWELFLWHAKRFLGKPAADRGLVYLLNQTYEAEQKLHMAPELPNLAVHLRGIVQDLLSSYDDKQRAILELKRDREFAEAKAREADLKGSRPADIYRAYARPLRWLCDHGQQHLVGASLRRLLLDQTMPEAELDNPDWVDPYTGDAQEPEPFLNIRVGKDVEEVEAQSMLASESFNAEDGLETEDALLSQAEKAWAEIQTDEIVKDFAFQSEVTVTDGLPELRRKMGAVTRALRTDLGILAAAARQAEFDTLEEQNAWISRRIRTRDSFKDFWLALKREAQLGAAPQDLAAVSLEFQNETCYPEQMFDHVPLVPQRGGCSTLGQWLDLFADEMIENLLNRDPLGISADEPPLEEIEAFVDETMTDMVAAQSDQTGKDITRTPAFLRAYYTAAINARDLIVDGRNIALEAGWDAWRESKSPAGNRAYRAALKEGKPPKEAMKAFWSVVNGGQRTARIDRVVSIAGDRSGLVLASGRRVNWRIALMKLQSGELEWEDERRSHLKDILLRMGVGLEFARAL